MSDEPSDAQKLIAEVLKPLIYADMRYPDELFAQRRAEAYAAEVDKALGGLIVEWAPCRDHCGIGTIYEQSMIHPTREGAEKRCRQAYTNPSAWDIRRRFISSGWTVTE